MAQLRIAQSRENWLPCLHVSLTCCKILHAYLTLQAALTWSIFERLQLKSAKEDLKSLRLQKDFAGGRKDIVAFVHLGAVDEDGDPLVRTDALHPGPLTPRTFDVLLASRVEEFLEIGIVT